MYGKEQKNLPVADPIDVASNRRAGMNPNAQIDLVHRKLSVETVKKSRGYNDLTPCDCAGKTPRVCAPDW